MDRLNVRDDPPTSDPAPCAPGLEGSVPHRNGRHEVHKYIRQTLCYVPSLARRYRGRGMTLDELVAAGNLGLVEAALRFDPARGVRFTTYANWWIRKAILESLGHQLGPMRLPRYQHDRLRILREARASWISRHSQIPTLRQLSRRTGIPLDEVNRLMALVSATISLEQPVGPNDDRQLKDTLEDERCETPDRALVRRELRHRLRARVAELASRERQVLALRFGLADGIAKTLRETGQVLGISRERVRQVELRALVKLKQRI